MSPLEIAAVVITLAAVYLTTRQVIACWPLAMVGVALYGLVFYEAKLYADMGLQGLYFAMSAYGWWAWSHGGEGGGELPVSRTTRGAWLLLAGGGALASITLGQTLSRTTDASLPFLDSTLTAFSVVAQWMQTRKQLDAWAIWIVLNVFYVGMFLYKELYPTAGLYAVFIVLAVSGFIQWRRSMNTSENGSGLAAARS